MGAVVEAGIAGIQFSPRCWSVSPFPACPLLPEFPKSSFLKGHQPAADV